MNRFKNAGLVALVVLGALIPAAHLNRWHGIWEALAWLAPAACLIFTRREFPRRANQALALAGSLITVDTMLHFVRLRQATGEPWLRLAVILSVAALVTALAAWALEQPLFARNSRAKADASGPREFPVAGFAAWAVALALLAVVQLKVRPPMLLAERFAHGAGWLEISLLALYAGFTAEALCDPLRASKARRRAWGLFSLAFFGQLALGLAGFKDFLMTGALHLPVPALIVAGPLFRGEGLFMLCLFSATVLLVGPAWCSHLCYIGAWDSAMSQARKRPSAAPAWLRRGRILLAAAVFGVAWALGRMGVTSMTAVWLAGGFGLAGVGIMAFASRRTGVMAHCSGWCPMGLLAGLAGKLSPWRLRIGSGCKGCGVCSLACRYDALRPEDLGRKRPGVSCSLCRDCLGACPKSEMELTFLGRSGPWVWATFSAVVAALHAVFLGVARI
ncbi:4Fe-4S binding protein [Fundidesulfovibrio soli]|uniref:4Fe-4S binding protein n=1 Tax=Fundidesulfovibrio soli TaxID=2922716 RepID=UPI001FAFBFCB|nr:ferredoxin family protein [Fundidesulfovibrio soli]